MFEEPIDKRLIISKILINYFHFWKLLTRIFFISQNSIFLLIPFNLGTVQLYTSLEPILFSITVAVVVYTIKIFYLTDGVRINLLYTKSYQFSLDAWVLSCNRRLNFATACLRQGDPSLAAVTFPRVAWNAALFHPYHSRLWCNLLGYRRLLVEIPWLGPVQINYEAINLEKKIKL